MTQSTVTTLLDALRRILDRGLGSIAVWRSQDCPRFEAPRINANHAVPTVVTCLTGVVRLTSARMRLDLHPGEGVLIGPGAWHEHHPLRRGSAFYGQGFVGTRSDAVLTTPAGEHLALVASEPAWSLLSQALTAQPDQRRELVAACARQVLDQPLRPFGSMPAAVARMAEKVWWTPSPDLTIDAVVRASGLGRTQAHAQFRAWFGTTPKALLTDQRLVWALEALRGGATVAVAAAQAGFAQRVYFTRAFTARFGVSPRQWRSLDLRN